MKRLFLLLASVAITSTALAEGYQVNTLSAKQLGMGHVGTGMKLNSESIHFNPAATAFQTSKFDISAGITGIFTKATYTANNDYTGAKPYSADSDNKMATPMYVYFNYKPIDKLAIGISLTTPYGSSMNWGDNWKGAHLIQSINLQSFSVQPTVSYKICDKLAIGAGMMIAWGNFDLSRSMLPVGAQTNSLIATALTASGMGQYAPIITAAGDNALVSAKLQGDAKIAIGANVGIMYDINDEWTLGFSYRSKMKMKATKGTAELKYLNKDVQSILEKTGFIPALNQGTFTAELPMPTNLTWGVSFRPTKKWEFAVDLQWVGWSAYKDLNVSFNEPELKLEDINSVKNYDNTLIFRFGGQFHANKYLTARMGMYVDESPVRSDYLNPETPSMTKVSYTAGLSIRPTKFMSIDIAYGYISSADPERTGSYPYFNSLAYKITYAGAIGQGASDAVADATAKKAANQPFSGNYSLSAHTLSLGLSFSF